MTGTRDCRRICRSMADAVARRRLARILVVDDNQHNTLLMRELLSQKGYEVVTANIASEAEAEMRENPPDLVLLDVIMPDKSGYDLCRLLWR